MSKIKNCPVCDSLVVPSLQKFNTGKFDKITGDEIIVDNVAMYECSDSECKHSWLPFEEEEKIDKEISKRTRFILSSKEIKTIRESLPFSNKFKAAEFLCLNEKAFTKWENGYTELNRAYDLLLRLSVHSKSNFDFITHLHKTNFKFDPSDYELICNEEGLAWKFRMFEEQPFQGVNPNVETYRNVNEKKVAVGVNVTNAAFAEAA